MKKFLLIFSVIAAPVWAGAQTIANADMEAWRSNSAGSSPIVPIAAPVAWFGLDSLIISAGQAFGPLIGGGDDWNRQTYEENLFVHGGSAAVKLITVHQDTLGFMPGTLVNAQPLLNLSAITGGGNATDAIVFEGGTATTLRPTSVTAWVAYLPGKDATTGAFGGPDKGLLNVQAIATVDGADSIVGNAAAIIDPSTAYVSVTAPVTYTTTAYNVHTVRIIFASGGGSGAPLDSSILYVDDVSMVGEPQAVSAVYHANSYKVHPNPASNKLYITTDKHNSDELTILSGTGSVAMRQTLNSHNEVDLSTLAAGMYVYQITSKNGIVLQTGKVQVAR